MAFQGRHVDTSTLLGSWPVIPAAVSGVPVLLPRTMQANATIIGIAREPAGGYDVDGRSFFLNIDGSVKTINFSYGAPLPLSEVIAQINSDATVTVAYNNNGFLKLRSPTSGGSSYLKVTTDPASTPTDVFKNLGLFSETEAYAGDLTPAQHVDPDRQVATPGQMSMAEGENFESKVFNRAIAQLSINNDRNEGLLSKKRVAVRNSISFGSYTVPGAVHGVQLTGGSLVYVGKASSPSIDALQKLFAVLDSEGRELSKDIYYPTATGWTGTFFTSVDGSNRQEVASSFFDFAPESTYEGGNYYLLSNSFTGAATVLNGKPLKLLEIRAGSGQGRAIIENIDPATGSRVVITDASISITIVNRNRAKVVVNGVFENVTTATAGTPRLENEKVNKRTSLTPTRVELGNRIVCLGQNFGTSPAIQEGDIVTWSGATINSPFSNNGDYRVDKIIDKETIRVVAADWSAAVLNHNMTGGSVGTLTIKTDGAFVVDPFLRFPNDSFNPPPTTGEAIEIAHFRGTTIRQATDDNPALFQGDVRFTQEADETLARAIVRMWGPSVTSLDGVLYGDYRINLESINSRLNWEHYTYNEAEKAGGSEIDARNWGRHKDIRPDTIDMWLWASADYSDPKINLRSIGRYSKSYNAGTSFTDRMDTLLKVVDYTGTVNLQINGMGSINNVQDQDIGLGLDNRVWMDMTFNNPRADSSSGGGLPTLGDYYISGERIAQRLKHKWYSSLDSAGTTTLVGSHLITDLELTSSSAQPFVGIYGQRIEISGTSNNAVWTAGSLKFLELTGSLQKTSTTHTDNQDAVGTLYGVHVGYTLSTNFRIYSNHYGIKVEDILRAGTATGGSGANYAIHTSKGLVHFGDYLDVSVTNGTSGYTLGRFTGSWNNATTWTLVDGVHINTSTSHTTGTMSDHRGLLISALAGDSNPGGSTTRLSGIDVTAHCNPNHTVGTLYGVLSNSLSGGTVTNHYGIGSIISGSNATNRHAFHAESQFGGASGENVGYYCATLAGTPSNNYGLYIVGASGATSNNYGIYVGPITGTGAFSIRTTSGTVQFGGVVQPASNGLDLGTTSLRWEVFATSVDATGAISSDTVVTGTTGVDTTDSMFTAVGTKTDGVLTTSSNIVTSATGNFVANGVVAGMYLHIKEKGSTGSSGDIGWKRIIQVDSATQLRVATTYLNSSTGVTFEVIDQDRTYTGSENILNGYTQMERLRLRDLILGGSGGLGGIAIGGGTSEDVPILNRHIVWRDPNGLGEKARLGMTNDGSGAEEWAVRVTYPATDWMEFAINSGSVTDDGFWFGIANQRTVHFDKYLSEWKYELYDVASSYHSFGVSACVGDGQYLMQLRSYHQSATAATGVTNHGIICYAGKTDQSDIVNYMLCYTGSKVGGGTTQVGALRNTAGTFGAVDTSDPRVKYDMQPTKVSGLDVIKKLQPVEFKWKANHKTVYCGFNAENCEEVYPQMVSRNPDETYGELRQTMKAILIPVIVKAMQEQQTLIEGLKQRVAALEAA